MSKRSSRKAHSAKSPRSTPLEKGLVMPAVSWTKWYQGHGVVIALLMAICAVLYVRTVDYPMVFDDAMYLTDNPIFRDVSNFAYPFRFEEFAQRPEVMGIDPDYAVNFIMRPVAYATFYLNYVLDGFRPRWFRIVNIALHTANALLVYALVHLLLYRAAGSGVGRPSRRFIAFTAAVFFAAHPLAIESVTYIVQRFTSQAAFFYLASLVLHFAAFARESPRMLLRAGSVGMLLLGMLSKECTVTAPLMAVMLDRLVLATPWSLAVRRAWPMLLWLPLIPGLVILTSTAIGGGAFDIHAAMNIVNSRDEPISQWTYLMTQITVVAAYLRLLVWPSGLNLDPQWPLYHSFLEKPVLMALGCLLAFVALIGWVRFRAAPQDGRMRAVWAFTLWYFISISVSSGLVPLPDMMAEHRTYLPSVGICFLVAVLLDRFREVVSGRKYFTWMPATITSILLIALCAATWARNTIWSSAYSLWADTASKSPGKYRVWSNLGAAASDAGRNQEALECFERSLQIEPRFQNGMFNLANSLLKLGRVKESVSTMERMMQLNKMAGRNPMALYQLGVGLARLGRVDDAVITLNKCLHLLPDHAGAHLVLALIRRQQQMHQMALHHFREVLRIQGANQEVMRAIAEIESMSGIGTR